ncbi:recombination protein RecA [Hydrogenivirga caldilitoris]|uniref:Protein RecA n=1 Tax=Hydrogenivirga caldilitoris TaxID=246264 RepID=A0A497XQX7_9AQUI|nr:recombinase RecA [Hydrogenivirga caldilitoris]RLJ71376.1 recombination protein RecA [Hydrogenivirga caldilitoris]
MAQETVEKALNEKKKALEASIANIEKRFGKGAIMPLRAAETIKVDVIPTGSLALDIATGIGGIPRGRIIEIFGVESSGKTTLALHVIAEAQKKGGVAVFIDAEHALDPKYAKALGVDVENLYISQPDYGEQALEIAESLINSGAVDVIVVDSVAALVPRDELEGEMGEAQVGKQARLMSQALRKLKGIVHKSNTALIFINQIREKIGVMFGNPETTPGGRALKFFSDMRLEVRRTGDIKEGNDKVGYRVKVKVVKNKLAPPFQEAEFDMIYGEGICRLCDLIDVATDKGILTKSGSWYSYGEQRLGQGKEQVKRYLSENPELAEEIERKVREVVGLVTADTEEGN